MKTNRLFLFATAIVAVFLILGAQFLAFPVVARAQLYTSAVGGCVLEAHSGRVLYGKNIDKRLAMASTTKIMTAITAILHCKNLDEKFEISPKAVGVAGTSLYLREGDVYSTRDLLYALMLISGNDASVAIAEHIAGSVSEFVTLMNRLACDLELSNTHFANTHGLDADGHYTTAYDLAKLTAFALENDTFREIVSTKNTKICDGNGNVKYLKNKNKLLFSLDGCIGVKTGFTDDAGRCLVSAVENEGLRLVCVVLNCGPMFEESAELLRTCAEEFKMVEITSLYDYDDVVKVNDGREEFVKIATKGKFFYPLTAKEQENLKFEYNINGEVDAPLKAGSEVGEIKVFLDNDLLFCEKVYTMKDVKSKTIFQRIKEFANLW